MTQILKIPSSTVHNIIKRFRNQEDWLCTWNMAKGQNWMRVILRPSGTTALKTGVILYWTSLHGPKNFHKSLSVNTVHRAIHKCQLKLHHAKKKSYMQTIQKHISLLWAKAHLKWFEAKWKTVLRSDKSKFEIIFGNHGCPVLWTKQERYYPTFISGQFKSLHLWWYGARLVSMVRCYTSGKAPSILKSSWRF